jgi:hypothetical protein
LLGQILVDLAEGGHTDADISPFSASRAILGEADPVRTYMV